MKLDSEFIRLPYSFDVDRLVHEVQAFDSSSWLPHPLQYPGNYSIPLISVNGQINDDFDGPMQASRHLQASPYMQQVIASFDEVFGRSRLMRLDGHSEVPPHADINYHWYTRVRIHIPIITSSGVTFFCGDKIQQMAAGECWLLDTWNKHWVTNESASTRVHLVIDTAGSAKFWNRVNKTVQNQAAGIEPVLTHRPYIENQTVSIQTEQFNAPKVMSPGEIDGLVIDLINDTKAHTQNDASATQRFIELVNNFRWEWRKLWSLYGDTDNARHHYQALIQSLTLPELPVKLASNEQPSVRAFHARVLVALLSKN